MIYIFFSYLVFILYYYNGVFHQVLSAPTFPPGLAKQLRLPLGQTMERLVKYHGMSDEDFTEMKANAIGIKKAVYELRTNQVVRGLGPNLLLFSFLSLDDRMINRSQLNII